MAETTPGSSSETMPLFPLNTVLFPGVGLPLHIFEERYRALVHHLLGEPDRDRRRFGIVAIREGYEVGSFETRSMYRVGCVVTLTSVEPYADGRFDIEVAGAGRIRVESTDTSTPYVTAEVTVLPEVVGGEGDGDEALRAAEATLETFDEYRRELGRLRGGEVVVGALPSEPLALSYALSATALLTLRERQLLLETESGLARLGRLRRTLREEMRAMRAVPSLPATEVARSGWSPN